MNNVSQFVGWKNKKWEIEIGTVNDETQDQTLLLGRFSCKTPIINPLYCDISTPPFSMIYSPKGPRTQLYQLFKVTIFYNLVKTQVKVLAQVCWQYETL